MNKLLLHQEIMLLALRDEEGTSIGAMYNHAIAGAVLSELLLQQKIETTEDKKRLVSISDSDPVRNALLDEVIQMIAAAKRKRPIRDWVMKVAMIKNLKHRVAQQLCDLKILKADEDKVLWVFPRKIYPEIAPKYERGIKDRMAKLMFGQTTQHDDRTTLLVSLASHAGLLPCNFDKERLKRNKDRIKKVANGDLFAARATKDTIAAVQAAVMAAAIIPTVAASN